MLTTGQAQLGAARTTVQMRAVATRRAMRRSACLQPILLQVALGIAFGAGYADPAAADAVSLCTGSADAAVRLDACTAVIAGKHSAADRARAYRLRGEARLSAGMGAEAIADFTEAIRLAPDDAIAYAGRGQAKVTRGDPASAVADLSEAIRRVPNSAFFHNARGHAHLTAGDAAAAAADFTESIRLDPASASARNNRGLARARMGSLDAAIADYTAAINLSPLYALAYNNRGYAYEKKGAKTEAIADFRRALEIDLTLAGARAGLERLGGEEDAARVSDHMVAEGRDIAARNCAWCHATGPADASPNAKAPPFRAIAARHPVLALREPLSRGIAAPHDEMPNFKLSDADVDRIIAYIDSLGRSPD